MGFFCQSERDQLQGLAKDATELAVRGCNQGLIQDV